MMIQTIVVFLILATSSVHSGGHSSWSYEKWGVDGPENWGHIFHQWCDGHSQSPIDIDDTAVVHNRSLGRFTFNNYDTTFDLHMELKNNGHTVKTSVGGETEITVSGGGLPGEFKVAQFHFHWGSSSKQGSEHLINSRPFPMELHIVHFNMKYGNFDNAIHKPDGLAVLGFMFEIQEHDNMHYFDLVSELTKVQAYHTETAMTPMALESLLPPSYRTSQYYRYHGSLTTPMCNEVVTWSVMVDKIGISERQVSAFRQVLDSHNKPIVNNFRPPQPINGRVVESSF